jgi:Rho GDP-dissociation inhibitor
MERSSHDRRGTPFKIKEGVKFSMTVKFKVQHETLVGLKYLHVVRRKGFRVSTCQERIGFYPPNEGQTPSYDVRLGEQTSPSGILRRGYYTATCTFIDDADEEQLKFEWAFNIVQYWDENDRTSMLWSNM